MSNSNPFEGNQTQIKAIKQPFRVPNRLSVHSHSPFFNADALLHVEVWFNGVKQKLVVEYDLIGQWIRRHPTNRFGVPKVDRQGILQIECLQGKLEVKWKE